MSERAIVLFGTGDLARTAFSYFSLDSDFDVVAFTVHERFLDATELLGRPVVPFERIVQTHPPDEVGMFVATGYRRVNRSRAELYAACKELGYELATYVSPKAIVAPEATLGDNCFVFEANVIQPYVKIGNDVIIWSGNHIGHDTTIGDHCFIASHAVISGNVTIGSHCFIGVNATVRNNITIAPSCVLGAGAVIMKDTVEGGIYSVRGTEPSQRKSWELEDL